MQTPQVEKYPADSGMLLLKRTRWIGLDHKWWCFLFVSIFIFSSAFSQISTIYQKNGQLSDEEFAEAVAMIGDADGDGKSDFIVGGIRALYGGNGVAIVYSGASGALLYQKNGLDDWFGFSVAGAGDVDGDGRADFIVGAPHSSLGGGMFSGSAYLYSGATGTLLYQKDGANEGDALGYSVSGGGDVNGDGRADFIVGAPGSSPNGLPAAGSAYVYSGATGVVLYQKDGIGSGRRAGESVAIIGDVNGDGRADFAADMGFGQPVVIFSGATGDTIYQKNGVHVAKAGDVDADGRPDFMTAIGTSIFVYSGATGALIHQKDSISGISIAGAGDVNGDGRDDFMAGNPFTDSGSVDNAGSVYLFSGATGNLLAQINGSADSNGNGDRLGFSVAGAGDLNGDGKAEIIVGGPRFDPNGVTDAGSAFVYSVSLPCPVAKGDMNNSGGLSPADVVLMLNCVFTASGICGVCFTDVNCSGDLSPADVVIELNMVFSGEPPPC